MAAIAEGSDGDAAIAAVHVADAVEALTHDRHPSLSESRAAKDPYQGRASGESRLKEEDVPAAG